MAYPARFERATWALEEFVAAEISIYFNGLHAEIVTVQKTVQCGLTSYKNPVGGHSRQIDWGVRVFSADLNFLGS